MKSILQKFANRDIPEEPHFKKNSRMTCATKRKAEDEEKLRSVLEGEWKEVFQHFLDSQAEINFLHGIDRFIDGYRLGVLMTMEVFQGNNREDF